MYIIMIGAIIKKNYYVILNLNILIIIYYSIQHVRFRHVGPNLHTYPKYVHMDCSMLYQVITWVSDR